MNRMFTALGLVFALSSTLWADDATYTIKFKEQTKGQICMYEVDDTGEVYFSVEVSGEKKVAQSMKFNEKVSYWEAIYEKPAGERPTKVMRGYGTARVTMDLPLLGVDNETVTMPYESKRVRIERKGDNYTYKVEGVDEQPPNLSKMMQNEWGSDEAMGSFLPKQAVALKETWRFDARPLIAGLVKQHSDKFDFDLKNVKGMGRMTEVYTKEGKQFGKLVSRIEIPITGIKKDGRRLELSKGDILLVQVNYDICIDGSLRVGTVKVVPYLKMNITITAEDKKALVTVAVKSERNVVIKPREAKK